MATNYDADLTEISSAQDFPGVSAKVAFYGPPPAVQSDILAVITAGAADAALSSRGFASTTVLQVGALVSDAAKAPNAAAVVNAIAAVADVTTLTSGGVSVEAVGFTPPSITGVLAQNQIDSIVAALVTLGLATDGR